MISDASVDSEPAIENESVSESELDLLSMKDEDIDDYVQSLIDSFMEPFKVTDTEGHFDVIARLNGGGIAGQAGALRHGISTVIIPEDNRRVR